MDEVTREHQEERVRILCKLHMLALTLTETEKILKETHEANAEANKLLQEFDAKHPEVAAAYNEVAECIEAARRWPKSSPPNTMGRTMPRQATLKRSWPGYFQWRNEK